VWIDVALERVHVAGCHEHSLTHLSSKNASVSLATIESTSQRTKKILDSFWKKNSNIKFYENPLQWEIGVVPCGQTDMTS